MGGSKAGNGKTRARVTCFCTKIGNYIFYQLWCIQPKLAETALLFYRVTDVPFCQKWNKIGRSSTPVEQQHTRKPPKINSCLLLAVQPYYAIKSNQDPAVIKMLGALGAGFDCASKVYYVSTHMHVQGFQHCIIRTQSSVLSSYGTNAEKD